jgi:hypothetical protein
MASVTIHLHREDTPHATVVPCRDGRHAFISLDFGALTLLLRGYDHEAADSAATIARVLTDAAADLRRRSRSAPDRVEETAR